MMRRLGLAALFLLPCAAMAEPVDTALVIGVDVSLSVDDSRYALQRDGTAAAFRDAGIARAIASGRHGAVEVTVMEFSDPDRQIVVVPWRRVASEAAARRLAAEIQAVKRSSHGLTGLADALLAARALLRDAPDPADRQVIDLSSDGMSNIGVSMPAARDAVIADGITVNGLPILSQEPWLATYYADYVIGGPDAFVEVARDPASFGAAMRRKLVRELVVSSLR